MYNNSLFGFMIQNAICKKYNIVSESKRAETLFLSNFEPEIELYVDDVVNSIFNELNITPIKCTTMCSIDNKDVPYNFILSSGKTMSIKTNINGNKICPREVGQAGFKKLNFYFSEIYGKPIENQDDIKRLIIEKIDRIFPIFVDKLFDADYLLWIFQKKEGTYTFHYHMLKKESVNKIEYRYSDFSFSKDYHSWLESNSLRYKGKTIAEVQIHKNRSFKFRFNMNNFINFIINNE